MINAMLAAGLEFSWLSIIAHMINLLILVLGLFLLLFKPVKKMILKRQNTLKEQIAQAEEAKTEAAQMKEKYDELMLDVAKESAKVSEEARMHAQLQTQHMIDEAESQAAEIIEHAKTDVNKEVKRAEQQLKVTVANVATDIAQKILNREIKEADDKKLIEDCLKQWGKDENN